MCRFRVTEVNYINTQIPATSCSVSQTKSFFNKLYATNILQKRLQTQLFPKERGADILHTETQGQASKISSWNRSCFEPSWIVALNIPPRPSDRHSSWLAELRVAELLGRHVCQLQVQHECIPQAILGTDVLCQAKPGQLSEARRWDVTVKLTT